MQEVEYSCTRLVIMLQEGAGMLMKLMEKDIFDMKPVISRSVYDAFCGKQESETENLADHYFK